MITFFHIFKNIYLFGFIALWIYIISYPLINKIFGLNQRTVYSFKEYTNMFIASIIPIYNLFGLYMGILEDIQIYRNKQRRK